MGRWDIILSKMVTMMVVWARMVIMVLNMVMFMVVVVKQGSLQEHVKKTQYVFSADLAEVGVKSLPRPIVFNTGDLEGDTHTNQTSLINQSNAT